MTEETRRSWRNRLLREAKSRFAPFEPDVIEKGGARPPGPRPAPPRAQAAPPPPPRPPRPPDPVEWYPEAVPNDPPWLGSETDDAIAHAQLMAACGTPVSGQRPHRRFVITVDVIDDETTKGLDMADVIMWFRPYDLTVQDLEDGPDIPIVKVGITEIGR